MSDGSNGVVRGVLRSYAELVLAGWPTLHPDMPARIERWARMTEAQLRDELDRYVAEASRPGCGVRIFWKLGPKRAYAGGNAQFAGDAGVTRIEQIIGLDDFDARLPWGRYAGKFRTDEERVIRSGEAMNIIERQQIGSVVNWNRVAKAPIRGDDGSVCGIFGMYETLDPELGRQLYWAQIARNDPPALALGA